MPSFTRQVADLVLEGPTCIVMLQAPQMLAQAIAAQPNAPVLPQPVPANAMIDTGATGTVITPQIAAQLGLQPVGATQVLTPTTQQPVQCNQYNVDLVFLPHGVAVPNVLVVEAPLTGQHIQCLIGRDVLRHGVLVYVGYVNQFTLSF